MDGDIDINKWTCSLLCNVSCIDVAKWRINLCSLYM